MAFTPKTLGGNIGAGGGASFFTYETDDTEAVVGTVGYFKDVDVNGVLIGGESTADGILRVGDIINVDSADGWALFLVTVSNSTTVSAIVRLSAV